MMKNLLLVPLVLGIIIALSSCDNNPISPKKKKQVTFPLTFKFVNTSDPNPTRIDVRFGAYWPKKDSSTYVLTGAGGAAVGQVISHTMKRMGYPGCEMMMVFALDEIWPDRDKEYPTYKWYYVEKRVVQDSSDAVMIIKWPQDTARADVHQFYPDTVTINYDQIKNLV